MPSFPILNLTHEAFSKYGRVLEPTAEELSKVKRPFIVLESVVSEGWRMAFFEVTQKSCDTLGCHPNTKETFEPVRGTVALILASHDRPDDVAVFFLDRPVVVNEGVWHNQIALSEKACLRINENLNVKGESHRLPFTIKAEIYAAEAQPPV